MAETFQVKQKNIEDGQNGLIRGRFSSASIGDKAAHKSTLEVVPVLESKAPLPDCNHKEEVGAKKEEILLSNFDDTSEDEELSNKLIKESKAKSNDGRTGKKTLVAKLQLSIRKKNENTIGDSDSDSSDSNKQNVDSGTLSPGKGDCFQGNLEKAVSITSGDPRSQYKKAISLKISKPSKPPTGEKRSGVDIMQCVTPREVVSTKTISLHGLNRRTHIQKRSICERIAIGPDELKHKNPSLYLDTYEAPQLINNVNISEVNEIRAETPVPDQNLRAKPTTMISKESFKGNFQVLKAQDVRRAAVPNSLKSAGIQQRRDLKDISLYVGPQNLKNSSIKILGDEQTEKEGLSVFILNEDPPSLPLLTNEVVNSVDNDQQEKSKPSITGVKVRQDIKVKEVPFC